MLKNRVILFLQWTNQLPGILFLGNHYRNWRRYYFLFSFLTTCFRMVYEKGTQWNKMKVKEQGGREKQVGATPHFKSAKHRVRCTMFFGVLCAFLFLLFFIFLLLPFSNHNFFHECALLSHSSLSLIIFTSLFSSLASGFFSRLSKYISLFIFVQSVIRHSI